MHDCNVESLDARLERWGSGCVVSRTIECASQTFWRLEDYCALAAYGPVQSHRFKIEDEHRCAGSHGEIRARALWNRITFTHTTARPCENELDWPADLDRLRSLVGDASPVALHWWHARARDAHELEWPVDAVDASSLRAALRGLGYVVSDTTERELWTTGRPGSYSYSWTKRREDNRLIVSWWTLPMEVGVSRCVFAGRDVGPAVDE
jgi:hypothetical protein